MISLSDLEQLTEAITFPAEMHASDQHGTAAGEAVFAHPAIEEFAASTPA
jgi:hypothetical protein